MDEMPWEQQKRLKYGNHDFAIEDLTDLDLEIIRSNSIANFTKTKETSVIKSTIRAFMVYLNRNNLKITRDK